jgi:cholest-4-en-3-one 26-monooxygenase
MAPVDVARERPPVGNEIVDGSYYQRHGYPHAAWTSLRSRAPIAWFEPKALNARPFWAITKYRDLETIARDSKRFQIGPRIAVFEDDALRVEPPMRHLLNMDPPDHGKYRGLMASRFTPKTLEPKRPAIGAIVDDVLDEIAGRSEIDFVESLAAIVPLAVINEMLGIPRADWKRMFELSNTVLGASDPEYQQGATTLETTDRARDEFFDYFRRLAADRRREPREDFATILANSVVDGEPIREWELLSYFVLLIVAGNETTRNATSGGLLALMEHPAELEKLRRSPELLPSAVEEIVRWVSPVIQFCRTPTEDVEISGVRIRAGEACCLFYPSANRDEDVFEDPFSFRIDRSPNEHVGFGIGVHFCLGANLARLELQEIFRRLVPRLEEVELAGPVERMRSSFVGGIKRMRLKLRLR